MRLTGFEIKSLERASGDFAKDLRALSVYTVNGFVWVDTDTKEFLGFHKKYPSGIASTHKIIHPAFSTPQKPRRKWDDVKATWTKAGSFVTAARSRGVLATALATIGVDGFGDRIDLETRNLRRRSCFGDQTNPPCRALGFGKKEFHFCNECGCGEKELARLDAIGSKKDQPKFDDADYTKLDYPDLQCPLKRPGFSNAEKLSARPQINSTFVDVRGQPSAGLADRYPGCAAFLICAGPSLGVHDLRKLRQPGIMTMAINNAGKVFRPDFWIHGDEADRFIRSMFLDPRITCLSPWHRRDNQLFNSDTWTWMQEKVKDCPNVTFFHEHELFDAPSFLSEKGVCWSGTRKGSYSTMLSAIKLLYVMGFRKIYLLGCDFRMSSDYSYAFKQNRKAGAVSNNTRLYHDLIDTFGLLEPFFDKAGFQVFNCNKQSELKVFPFKSFDDAVDETRLKIDVEQERTEGLYDEPKGKLYSTMAKYGDVILALAAIKADGGGDLMYVPGKFYKPQIQLEVMKRLLLAQPYVHAVSIGDRPSGVYLDQWRNVQNEDRRKPLRYKMAMATGKQPDWPKPWLTIPDPRKISRVVLHRSLHYFNAKFPWKAVVEKYGRECVFVGWRREWEAFCDQFGTVPFYETGDMLDVAQVVAGCDLLVSNQAPIAHIADGIAKPSIMEVWADEPAERFHRVGEQHFINGPLNLP